uniref:RIN4 pathogenic type III effector avirulence factor Avr cleavage site domain-containing protein n=1 Tax=Araucaria cunninghamii TaxID=56994 RepID=A0A0D6QZY8_ARACU
MAQRPTHVPKFGNWTEDHVPYTAVFDHARAGKGTGGKLINPNDPEENPAAFAQHMPSKSSDADEGSIPGKPPPPLRRTSDSESNGAHVAKPRHERRYSREDGENKRPVGSPSRYQFADSPARRPVGESPGHRYNAGRSTTAGGSSKSNTSDLQRREEHHHTLSQDQSPAHHLYQGRLGNKPGAASPAWDRKGSVDGGANIAPATPGRKSRGGSAQVDETPERGGPLPKFGAWNENDPASADGFTFIFNKAREEKQTGGATKLPSLPPETPSRDSGYKQGVQQRKKSFLCCCGPSTSE